MRLKWIPSCTKPQGIGDSGAHSNRGVKAARPIAIEEGVFARALSGVRVTERKTALQTAFSIVVVHDPGLLRAS